MQNIPPNIMWIYSDSYAVVKPSEIFISIFGMFEYKLICFALFIYTIYNRYYISYFEYLHCYHIDLPLLYIYMFTNRCVYKEPLISYYTCISPQYAA